MTDPEEIRNQILKTINNVLKAKNQYREEMESLDNNIKNKHHSVINRDDEIERQLSKLENRSNNIFGISRRKLLELGLERNHPVTYTHQSNLSLQQAMQQLSSLVNMSEQTMQEIELLSQRLLIERKKWWKFW